MAPVIARAVPRSHDSTRSWQRKAPKAPKIWTLNETRLPLNCAEPEWARSAV